jgi:hypothetical protein
VEGKKEAKPQVQKVIFAFITTAADNIGDDHDMIIVDRDHVNSFYGPCLPN